MPGMNLTATTKALNCGNISDPSHVEQLRALDAESRPAVGSAPATASSTGAAGQIAYDATHIYVCVATNTWVRAVLATF